MLLYTSGTTGRSKGCITTHRGTIAQVQGVLHNFLILLLARGDALPGAPGPDGVPVQLATLLTSPLFHVAGLHSTVCTSMTAGSKLVFGPPKFDAEEVMQIIERERVTTWMAIPTLLQRFIEHEKLGELRPVVAAWRLDRRRAGGARAAAEGGAHAARPSRTPAPRTA